jgi:tetratricopeptide (TPR) repeat protein
MRLSLPEGTVNYHDFLLVRSSDGKILTDDIYIFVTGELFSQTLRRIWLNLMGEPKDGKQGLVERLKGSDQLYMKHLNELRKIPAAIRLGQGKEALAIFRKLPAELQRDKSLQIMAITAAQDGPEEDYAMELERFRKTHPKDAAIDFLSIDYYIIKKQYDEAVKATDRVDQALGGDPFLQVKKGDILFQAGKNDQAKKIVEKAIKDDPKMVFGYLTRVGIALEEKNHPDTLTWLKKLEESGLDSISLANIRVSEDYAAFVKSPEFEKLKTWLAERKK